MTYIFIFIGFLVFVFFIQKFNKGQMATSVQKAQAQNPLRDFASALGLQFEELNPGSNKNTMYSVGSRAWGLYSGIPVEILYASRADMGSLGTNYSYSMQKTITLTVKNPTKKSFDIVGGKPVVGDPIIPNDIAEYFTSLGWMHLTLKDEKLTFHDTFYDQFQGVGGGMQMMSAVHPIWKSSASSWGMDIPSGKKFLDTLVDLSKRANLI